MKKEWIYKVPDPQKVQEISSALGVSHLLATLLVNRDVASLKEAELFLIPDLSRLHNPFLLPDMEKAVLRVRTAVDRKEKILIYGDRDVDGVTSLAILVRTLKGLNAEVVWTIPAEEGYGLHSSILERYKKEGVGLVITVDCGTSAVEGVAFANAIGMDVIVTDHHLPPEILPPAYAIVNPNLKHSEYPMKGLAGCLTAFKFAYALMYSYNRNFNREFVVLDLETTGLYSSQHEIVEIGAARLRNFVPVKKFHTLVRPSKPIEKDAMEIHGITDAMVAESPPLNEVLPELIDFIGERTVVAHNAKFDVGFLQEATENVLGRKFENPFIDTLALSREQFSFRSHALSSLVKDLKIDLPQAHRAMDDCLATASLFQKIEEQHDPRLQFFLEDQLDLVTLGTIADIVPLAGENRIIVKHGLPRLLKTRKVGLRKLIEASGVREKKQQKASPDATPTAKEISWNVTPLLNAAGRLSKADLSARLLMTDNETEASHLVQEIAGLNQDRRNLQKINIEKFFQLAQEQCDLKRDKLIFVLAKGVEHGVTGIVASQMLRQFQKPVVLLIQEDGEAMGSSRSVPGFNIVQALEKCKDILIKYGGHPAAAGLSVELKNTEELRRRLKRIAETEINAESSLAKVEIDAELQFESITSQLIEEIATLEPFGEGNPSPIFVVKGAQVSEESLVGERKNHLRLRITDKGKSLNAIGWDMVAAADEFNKGDLVDLVFQLELNRWKDRDFPQLILADLRQSSKVKS